MIKSGEMRTIYWPMGVCICPFRIRKMNIYKDGREIVIRAWR
jgi:hypothetical protein